MTIEVGKSGGGVFVTRFASATLVIAAGASGAVFTITPPTGQRVKLNALSSNGTESNTEITVGGVAIISGKALARMPYAAGSYCILVSGGDPNIQNMAGALSSIVGNVDEAIVFKLITGSTVGSVKYSYEFGVVK